MIYPFHRTRLCFSALALLLGVTLVACSAPRTEVPLFDPLHQPQLLTESTSIQLPASEDANRFVRGWRDRVKGRKRPPILKPLGSAVIQGVQLQGRTRSISLDAITVRSGTLDYRFALRPWQTLELSARIEIPIPEDLPLGRFRLEVRHPRQSKNLGIKGAALSDALPAGSVEVSNGHLVQSGWSIAEVVHKLQGSTRLTGLLRPPTQPEPNQVFRLDIETSQGTQTVLEWSANDRQRGSQEIDLQLPRNNDYVRFRFIAEGQGAAAQWRNLALDFKQQPQIKATPPPAPPKVVVLYIMDALRSDYLEHLGGPAGISPTIDQLASEGVTFTNHFSVAPNTVPSTKSLLTGQKFLLKGGAKLSPDAGQTLAEQFASHQFRTGLFSGNGNVSSWLGMTRGFESDSGKTLWRSSRRRALAGYNNSAELLHREALSWLETLAPEDAAFLHIQTVNPHNPYNPPEPFRSQFVPENESAIDGSTQNLKDIRRLKRTITTADEDRLKGLYAASVAYNDAHLKGFLTALRERYDDNEILFILTSDHGEELFEHGGVLHGYTLYDEMLRIPLVVWAPGLIRPGRVEALTDNVDLHATLASLVSNREAQAGRQDETLWPYLTGGANLGVGKEIVFAAAASVKGGIFMARTHDLKVVLAPRQSSRGAGRWGMGQGRGRGHDAEYVFDLTTDPEEHSNLAGSASLESDWLRQQLKAWIELGSRLESGEAVGEMDDATRESLEALGYL